MRITDFRRAPAKDLAEMLCLVSSDCIRKGHVPESIALELDEFEIRSEPEVEAKRKDWSGYIEIK